MEKTADILLEKNGAENNYFSNDRASESLWVGKNYVRLFLKDKDKEDDISSVANILKLKSDRIKYLKLNLEAANSNLTISNLADALLNLKILSSLEIRLPDSENSSLQLLEIAEAVSRMESNPKYSLRGGSLYYSNYQFIYKSESSAKAYEIYPAVMHFLKINTMELYNKSLKLDLSSVNTSNDQVKNLCDNLESMEPRKLDLVLNSDNIEDSLITLLISSVFKKKNIKRIKLFENGALLRNCRYNLSLLNKIQETYASFFLIMAAVPISDDKTSDYKVQYIKSIYITNVNENYKIVQSLEKFSKKIEINWEISLDNINTLSDEKFYLQNFYTSSFCIQAFSKSEKKVALLSFKAGLVTIYISKLKESGVSLKESAEFLMSLSANFINKINIIVSQANDWVDFFSHFIFESLLIETYFESEVNDESYLAILIKYSSRSYSASIYSCYNSERTYKNLWNIQISFRKESLLNAPILSFLKRLKCDYSHSDTVYELLLQDIDSRIKYFLNEVDDKSISNIEENLRDSLEICSAERLLMLMVERKCLRKINFWSIKNIENGKLKLLEKFFEIDEDITKLEFYQSIMELKVVFRGPKTQVHSFELDCILYDGYEDMKIYGPIIIQLVFGKQLPCNLSTLVIGISYELLKIKFELICQAISGLKGLKSFSFKIEPGHYKSYPFYQIMEENRLPIFESIQSILIPIKDNLVDLSLFKQDYCLYSNIFPPSIGEHYISVFIFFKALTKFETNLLNHTSFIQYERLLNTPPLVSAIKRCANSRRKNLFMLKALHEPVRKTFKRKYILLDLFSFYEFN